MVSSRQSALRVGGHTLNGSTKNGSTKLSSGGRRERQNRENKKSPANGRLGVISIPQASACSAIEYGGQGRYCHQPFLKASCVSANTRILSTLN
jgi:hypothetical protein